MAEEEAVVFSREALEAAAAQGRERLDPQSKEAAERTSRGSGRTPFNGMDKKLEVFGERDPNFYYRWFLNKGDRILRAMAAGYHPCVMGEGEYQIDVPSESVEQGSWITQAAGDTGEGRANAELVLMAIKKEFHEQDQQAKAAQVDAREADIRRGEPDANAQGSTVYADESNSIQTNFRRN